MRVSVERPGWRLADVFINPAESPFVPDSIVQSILIDYPNRKLRTSGTDSWFIYFFITSLTFALIFKPFLKVKI